jgi:putative peptidoglycan lipid II flippase
MTIRQTRIVLIVYWLALAAGTHWPRLALPGQDAVVFGLDKWLHALAYAGLVLLLLASGPGRRGGRASMRLACVLAVAVYIVVDELTQPLVPGRTYAGDDLVASYLGLAGGLGSWALGRWLRRPAAHFVDHARLMTGLTLVSRCFGLVRDWALAFALGFGAMFDAFAVALIVPNLFRRLFGEGALAGAFLPHYTRLDARDKLAAQRFAGFVLRRLLGGLLLVAAVVAVGLFVVGQTVAPFGSRGNATLMLTAITIWYAPLICCVAILGAVLQVHGRFGVPSAMPVILNVAIIVTALLAHAVLDEQPERITLLLAIAVVVAGLIQLIVSHGALARADVKLDALLPGRGGAAHPDIREPLGAMTRQWLPTMLGLAVFQLNTLVDALIALGFSGEPDATIGWLGRAYPMQVGSVAVLGAAARLYEFPLGVFGIALATAIFPALARVAENRARFGDLVRQGLRLTLFIGLPATVGLIAVRRPLCQTIYHAVGAIDSEDAPRIAWVLLGYASAVWAYAINHVLVRAFYAQHRPQTPARVAVTLVGLNIVLNLVLIWPLGAAGLAWSTAICQVLQALILLRLCRRYVDRPVDRDVALSGLRALIGSVVMGAAVMALVHWLPVGTSWPATVGRLAAAVAGGAMIYIGAARLLGMEELAWTLGRRVPAGLDHDQ